MWGEAAERAESMGLSVAEASLTCPQLDDFEGCRDASGSGKLLASRAFFDIEAAP